MSYLDRLSAPGPKRLLALDGGGIRGLISIEVLSALEQGLRTELDRPDLVLADFFDGVGGTSAGAIIAAALSLGKSVAEIRDLFTTLGQRMFTKPWLPRRLRYLYRSDPLATSLQAIFGARTTLGDESIRCLLMMVLRNATTDSPWPVSNNVHAKYNDRSRPDCNLDLPLWQLVRASTAAPVYFPAEVIKIGGRRHVFEDGGIASNNPAFQLFLMTTMSNYRLCWPAGEQELLLVSVGAGYHPDAHENLRLSSMHVLYNARRLPAALISSSSHQQDVICRTFGRCLVGGKLDAELGDLHDEQGPLNMPKQFTYLRYNAELTQLQLDELGLPHIESRGLARLDSVTRMDDLRQVGLALGRREVDMAHYRPFLPSPRTRATGATR